MKSISPILVTDSNGIEEWYNTFQIAPTHPSQLSYQMQTLRMRRNFLRSAMTVIEVREVSDKDICLDVLYHTSKQIEAEIDAILQAQLKEGA